MTPRALTYEALNYLGPDLNTITLAGARKCARIAADLTAALQEIAKELPEIYKTRRGQAILAPETISVDAVNGSADVTFTGTFVNGCTIRLAGDPAWNEVRVGTAGQKMLLFPFQGATGTVSATLYHDAIELASDEAEILGRPLLEGRGFLTKASNRAELVEHPRESRDFGRRIRSTLVATRTTGNPTHFWVENFYDHLHATKRRIRLYPYPDAAGQLSYDTRLDARTIAASDLGTDAADSTVVIPIQDDMFASILRPIFLENWSSCPWFRDEEAKKAIKEDAKAARALMTKLKTQRTVNRRLRPTM